MSDEIHLAFSHPGERAASTQTELLDRISVRDLVQTIEIGAFQAERGTTQRIRFNVVVEVRPWDEPLEDDVDRILSYDKVTEAIEGELSEERLNLLETLAERVADRILSEPQAVRAFVRIEKLDRGPGTLGVEIVRTSTPKDQVRALADTPEPILLVVSNEAFKSEKLVHWIDAAEDHTRPVILCVRQPKVTSIRAKHPMAQRRIDLLAIEQNAWVLASLDKRCVVVGTRTELDWGMRNDQISVWAPSKMILDAVDGPEENSINDDKLLHWFAQEVAAVGVVELTESALDGKPIFEATAL